MFEVVPIDAVFDREWTSDVHFACYSVIEPGAEAPTSDPFPRIRKTAVSSIRDAGGEVVVLALALDFDLKDQPDLPADSAIDEEGKPIWTTALLDAFLSALPSIDEELAERRIAAPLVYTTTHGARFVHRLTRPVVCEDAEDLLRGLHRLYGELGIVLDPLSDWTRLFRAPKVRRGRVNTGGERWFTLRWGTGLTDPDAIDPVTKAEVYRDRYETIEPVTAAKPSPENCVARLYVSGKSGQKKTEMHKAAERILRGTDCFAPIFEMQPLAFEGSRDLTLIRLVGQATSYLLGPMVTDSKFGPEDIYALFLGAVQDFEPDPGTPDWTESLWKKVCTCFERETAKIGAQRREAEQRREVAIEKSVSLLEEVRKTCHLPELHSEDPVTAQTALRRLMLIREPSGRFRALRHDGGYTRIAACQGGLHFLIGRAAGVDDIIELWTTNDKGKIVAVPEQQIARQATEILRVDGASGIEKSHVVGDSWDNLVLRLALYRRNPDLAPEFDQQVDDWLELLTSDSRALKRWIAYALHFEGGPICALSLSGAPGAGKGMLAQGLVETLEHPIRADKAVLVTRFNDSLARTPWLVVDEGLPMGQLDIADTFRSLTAGDPIKVEEKFQTPIQIRNPMRIMFLANNDDVVQQLASHRVNDMNDQLALAQRILHLDVPDKASIHLRSFGGLRYTRGWVEGADGSPSDFRLAKHLLWIHAHRDSYGEPDKRLLVEGRPNTSVVQNLRTSGKVAQAISCAILAALENPIVPAVANGVAVEAGELYVTVAAIELQHRQLRESHISLTAGTIGQALRNLCAPGSTGSTKRRLIALSGSAEQHRWWQIDAQLLWRFAEEAGYQRSRLECIMKSRGMETDE